jgi:hypothetical protein
MNLDTDPNQPRLACRDTDSALQLGPTWHSFAAERWPFRLTRCGLALHRNRYEERVMRHSEIDCERCRFLAERGARDPVRVFDGDAEPAYIDE